MLGSGVWTPAYAEHKTALDYIWRASGNIKASHILNLKDSISLSDSLFTLSLSLSLCLSLPRLISLSLFRCILSRLACVERDADKRSRPGPVDRERPERSRAAPVDRERHKRSRSAPVERERFPERDYFFLCHEKSLRH